MGLTDRCLSPGPGVHAVWQAGNVRNGAVLFTLGRPTDQGKDPVRQPITPS